MSAQERGPVIIDPMGGDRNPKDLVKGAIAASEEWAIPIMFVGDRDVIGEAVRGYELIHTDQVVEMKDDPRVTTGAKDQASMVLAAAEVKNGNAGSLVSVGNTGALYLNVVRNMGRVHPRLTPAIAAQVPSLGEHPSLLLDVGAAPEANARQQVFYARMGAVFSAHQYGIEEPRVGLLVNGTEKSKGNSITREAYKVLEEYGFGPIAGRFIGNVEPTNLLSTETADVFVTDGLRGNEVLKALERVARIYKDLFIGAMNISSEVANAVGVLLQALEPTLQALDPEMNGGAVILGVDGTAVKSHGSSSGRELKYGVKLAYEMSSSGIVDALKTNLNPDQYTEVYRS
jgi:glycerol-3-phosphate acyltransferase PlsX